VRITASTRFLRRARRLKPPRDELLRAVLRRFAADPKDPLLRAHKLKGDLRDYWAFRVDDDLRVLFRWDGNACFLVALGTHDEID
jgi:mRNA-degrading endonuclease YafQ of YafQ-DinJ toxin-antitoxin module